MKTMRRRWIVAALLLLALTPADLALARLALRRDLTASVTGAVRERARTASEAGADVVGHGIHALGNALVEGACWVADVAAGAAPSRMANAGRRAARVEALACRLAECGATAGRCRQTEVITCRIAAHEAAALLAEDTAVRMAGERHLIERARVRIESRRHLIDQARARIDRERVILRMKRIQAPIERERGPVYRVMVIDVRDGAASPLPAPAVAGGTPGPGPRTGS